MKKLFMLGLGLLAVAFWLEFICLDVQATEAFFNGGKDVLDAHAVGSTMNTLMQVPNIIMGNIADPHTRVIICLGWGLELIYAICIAGFQICHSAIGYHNPTMAGWFKSIGLCLVVFCLWTTGNYGTNLDIGGHIAYAAITGFCTAFLGIAGTALLENVAASIAPAKAAPAATK